MTKYYIHGKRVNKDYFIGFLILLLGTATNEEKREADDKLGSGQEWHGLKIIQN